MAGLLEKLLNQCVAIGIKVEHDVPESSADCGLRSLVVSGSCRDMQTFEVHRICSLCLQTISPLAVTSEKHLGELGERETPAEHLESPIEESGLRVDQVDIKARLNALPGLAHAPPQAIAQCLACPLNCMHHPKPTHGSRS